MKPIRISLPRILRIATIQKLTSITLGLFPFFVSSAGKADVEDRGSLMPRTELREPATSAVDGQPMRSTTAESEIEINAYNQNIAQFNRDVVMLRHLEREIRNMTFQESLKKEALERGSDNDLNNAFVLRRNAKIVEYNTRVRTLSHRKAAIQREKIALAKRQNPRRCYDSTFVLPFGGKADVS